MKTEPTPTELYKLSRSLEERGLVLDRDFFDAMRANGMMARFAEANMTRLASLQQPTSKDPLKISDSDTHKER